MDNRPIDHLNPSRLKIPYYLCNNRKEFQPLFQYQSRTNPSTNPTHPSQAYQQHYLSSNTYHCYDQLSDQNNSLRQSLQQLKKYNMHLRKKLETKQKELESTDQQFRQTLVKYNKRLETSNSEMATLLMEESRDYYKGVEKSRSRSKDKLIAIKNELNRIDCSEINKICGMSRVSPRREMFRR